MQNRPVPGTSSLSEAADETPDTSATLGQETDIGEQLRQITLRQRHFEKRLSAALDTDISGLDVLSHLMSHGPATPTELARHLGLSTATTTLVLNRLETAGHITRERHSSDGRKLVVRIMADSEHRAAQQVAPLIQQVDQRVAALEPEQRHLLAHFLSEVIACYDRVFEPSN